MVAFFFLAHYSCASASYHIGRDGARTRLLAKRPRGACRRCVAERVHLGLGSTCSSFIVGSLSRIFTSGGSSAISRSYHQPHPKT